MRSQRHAMRVALSLCVALSSLATVDAQSAKSEQMGENREPSRQELEKVRRWLWENPPNEKNRAERRKEMARIQSACDQLTPSTYRDYVGYWKKDDSKADALEAQHPALFYLRAAATNALTDIHKTKVKQGVVVWYIYNIGYVFKTPDACFGIDITMRDSEQLADVLDFLLITHEHDDHSAPALIDAMIKAGKPVITRWKEGTEIVGTPKDFTFGSCRVKVDIGDHHNPKSQDDMLMFQVDCGESANNCTIYHSGDGNNFRKMTPDKNVDIFIVHVQVGMPVEAAIAQLKPRRTFVSHVLELGHSPKPPNAWRWSLDYAFGSIRNIPENESMVLTWGERWLMPDTLLQ